MKSTIANVIVSAPTFPTIYGIMAFAKKGGT